MKPIDQWTRQELVSKMEENLTRFLDHRKKKGDRLTEEEIAFDGIVKKEWQRREELGLNEIPCMICTDNTVSYYDIMKEFCSDMTKITKNICNEHVESFNQKLKEFAK